MNQLSFAETSDPKETKSLFSEGFCFSNSIQGSIEKVLFFNSVTGQCLLETRVDDFPTPVLLTGFAASVFPGQSFVARGENQPLHQTFSAKILKFGPPNSPRNLKKFLKTEVLETAGKTVIRSLVETFSLDLLAILDWNRVRLTEAPGVGKKKQTQIIEAWRRYRSLSQLKEFLFRESLPLEWAEVLWSAYQDNGEDLFRKGCYKLARLHRFPFEAVDSYGLRHGSSLDSEERARCALIDLLWSNYKQGHCAFPETKLREETLAKLNCRPEVFEDALEIELVNKSVVEDSIGGVGCIYLREIWELEKQVAKELKAFIGKEPPWGWFNLDKVIFWAQSLLQIQLAPLQKEAIQTALSSALTVITGGPGTGKTTLVRSLTAILQTQHLKFYLCSPTGRAAKRLEEATGHVAQTIHRLLKYNSVTGTFACNRERPLEADLVLVDEFSMVDISLMHHLLEALPPQAALILVGDADQIPAVGAGNVLKSIIDSRKFTIVRLKEIFRQSEESLIKINAQRINHGEMPLKSDHAHTDFHYLPVHGVEEAKRMVIDLATRVIPQEYGVTDLKQVQILTPMNNGELGTLKLNQDLQRILRHMDSSGETLAGLDQVFSSGDKVMVIKNDYKKNIFNGDIGFIHHIDPPTQTLHIDFDDRRVLFHFEELDRLTLAYAISIHKSQGSEYRAVIVVLTEEHASLAQRHLIYTAVTRGKEHVFLVAEPKALQKAVVSDENSQRWQKLTELLQTDH